MNTPPAGWSTNRDGNPTFTVHGASFDVKPPTRDGFRCHFIARYGTAFTTWIYRAVTA